MKKPNTIEAELDKTRVKLYEQTRDMTCDERVAYFKSLTEPIYDERGWRAIMEPTKKEAVSS
jgi:hypothetical protein